MEVFHFCWINVLSESKKCHVVFDKNTCNVKDECEGNYEKPVNRVAYLYKYGTFNILFFHKCLNEFVLKAPNAMKILERLCSTKNLNVCSLSTGPGTDIIGLLYALHQFGKPLKEAMNFKIISKYGAWRNLVTEMINSQIARISESSTCKLIQADVLSPLPTKAQNYLKNADVILMCRVFSSHKATSNVIHRVLKDIFQMLKPGALVFFVSSQTKSAYFKELSTCGSFLYGPTEVVMVATGNLPYDEKIVDLVGVKPLASGSGSFSVWQKSETPTKPATSPMREIESVTKLASDSEMKQDSIFKLSAKASALKMDAVEENSVRKHLNAQSMSQGTSKIGSSISCDEPNFQRKRPIIRTWDVLLEEHCKNKNTNVESNSSSQSTLCNSSACNTNNHPKSKRSLFSKIDNVTCDNQHEKEENSAASMASLLKSFEGLVSKFEDFVTSQEMLKNSKERDLYYSSCRNLCESHCGAHCCTRNQCYSSSVKHCQTYNQSRAACSNDYISCQHICSHLACSFQHISSTPSCCSMVPQSSDPCLVIPLSNLSEDTIDHMLSLASQKNSK